jgi:hypothetical protein
MDYLRGKVTHAAANRGLVSWALFNSTPCVMIIPFAAANMGSWVWCNVNTGHERLAVADLKIECVGSIMMNKGNSLDAFPSQKNMTYSDKFRCITEKYISRLINKIIEKYNTDKYMSLYSSVPMNIRVYLSEIY